MKLDFSLQLINLNSLKSNCFVMQVNMYREEQSSSSYLSQASSFFCFNLKKDHELFAKAEQRALKQMRNEIKADRRKPQDWYITTEYVQTKKEHVFPDFIFVGGLIQGTKVQLQALHQRKTESEANDNLIST